MDPKTETILLDLFELHDHVNTALKDALREENEWVYKRLNTMELLIIHIKQHLEG